MSTTSVSSTSLTARAEYAGDWRPNNSKRPFRIAGAPKRLAPAPARTRIDSRREMAVMFAQEGVSQGRTGANLPPGLTMATPVSSLRGRPALAESRSRTCFPSRDHGSGTEFQGPNLRLTASEDLGNLGAIRDPHETSRFVCPTKRS